jgi:hypothetical protein
MNNLNSLFKINEESKIYVDYIEQNVKNSKFYVIDNFFDDPDSIVEFLNKSPTHVWKEEESPSFNTIYFHDITHKISDFDDICPVYDLLSNLCGQTSRVRGLVTTNMFKFYEHEFNDYHNNFWCPHKDTGYTGLIYLNENDNFNGTNIYKKIDNSYKSNGVEHYKPWVPKEKFELIMTIPPVYNRMFLFNASKYYHGMNIYNCRYSHEEYRLNLAFFFDDE